MNRGTIIVLIITFIAVALVWFFLIPQKNISDVQKKAEFPTINTTMDFSILNTKNKSRYETLTFPKRQKIESENYTIEEKLSIQESESEIYNFKEFGLTFNNLQTNDIQPLKPEEKEITEEEIEEKIFKRLYPDYFTNGLVYTQNIFIEQGFLDANYEKIEMFDSEEKIFSFTNTIIDVFEEQGFYTSEEATESRVGVNQVWKSLLDSEKRLFREELLGSKLSKKIIVNIFYQIRKQFSRKIIEAVKNAENIMAKKAYAGDCYREGAGRITGANVWAPCCDCGLICNRHGCYLVTDCRGRCHIDLGCKNLYGRGGRPVIWDPATRICGIG